MSIEPTVDAWTAEGVFLYRNGQKIALLPDDKTAEWVAEACETLAEMDAAQAVYEASGEAPHCSMVEVDGEEIRANARLESDADHAAFRELVTAARRKFVEDRAAGRAQVEREVRAEVSTEILGRAATFASEADRLEGRGFVATAVDLRAKAGYLVAEAGLVRGNR